MQLQVSEWYVCIVNKTDKLSKGDLFLYINVFIFPSWQDLVVGAPQFFDREAEIGGAAYVYINNKGNWNKFNLVRLNGTKDSMFGLAVENIGDIDQDGYSGNIIAVTCKK